MLPTGLCILGAGTSREVTVCRDSGYCITAPGDPGGEPVGGEALLFARLSDDVLVSRGIIFLELPDIFEVSDSFGLGLRKLPGLGLGDTLELGAGGLLEVGPPTLGGKRAASDLSIIAFSISYVPVVPSSILSSYSPCSNIMSSRMFTDQFSSGVPMAGCLAAFTTSEQDALHVFLGLALTGSCLEDSLEGSFVAPPITTLVVCLPEDEPEVLDDVPDSLIFVTEPRRLAPALSAAGTSALEAPTEDGGRILEPVGPETLGAMAVD